MPRLDPRLWTAQDIKDHNTAVRRMYYEKNKSKISSQAKARREAKMTEAQKKARETRQDMKTWSAEDKKEWRKTHRKEYYQANKQKILQKAKERRQVNKVVDDLIEDVVEELEGKPKRTKKTSDYNRFVKTRYQSVKSSNPSFKPTDVMKKLGQMWTELKKNKNWYNTFKKN